MSHRLMRIVGAALLAVAVLQGPGQARIAQKEDAPKEKKLGGDRPEEIIKRINENLEKSEDKLAKTDPREETQKVQERIVQDLDELIKRQQNSKAGASAKGQIAPSAENGPARNAGGQPKQPAKKDPKSQKSEDLKSGDDGANKDAAKKRTISDLKLEFWSDYPPKKRQEMEVYGKQRFLPKYEDLLRQYYRTISESDRRKD